MSDYQSLVHPLLEELEYDLEGLHVVALGGGTGLARALKSIQHYTDVITAVVTVADDGGSSGRLSPVLGIPPPGDVRQALLALSGEPSVWWDLIDFRFSAGDVAGHSLGNLILAALADLAGDFEDAVDTVGRLLGARGTVVPAADAALHLEAVIDGVLVSGQEAITKARGSLSELRIRPEGAEATGRAVSAIAGADQIVLGPGSLFTSIAACLRVPGIVEAIAASPAQLVYVCNLVTQDGETLGMSGFEHVEALIDLTGLRPPDVVVAHQGPIDALEPTRPVLVDPGRVAELGIRLEAADLADPGASVPMHDPVRLGAVLRRLA